MDEKEAVNRIRGLGFMAGVLEQQGKEPLCSRCISYAITINESRDAITELKGLVAPDLVPKKFDRLFQEADKAIMALSVPAEPERQRKSGRCHLPDKACFVKKARMLFLFFKEKKARDRK
jgi:hypothetical protein